MANARRSTYRRLHQQAKRPGDVRARCFYCGEECFHRGEDPGTVEHLHPKSQGGPGKRGNLRLAHKSCNAAVGNLPVDVKLQLAGNMERGKVPSWVLDRFRLVANAWVPVDRPHC